jgi:hypothetical protein
MYQMRESWTDARLDDFAAHVDQRFDAVDKRFDRVEGELHALRSDMDRRFDAMQKQMQDGFERMYRLMFQSSVAVVVALIALVATQI